MWRLEGDRPAIDGNRLACHHRAGIGSKIDDCANQIVGREDTANRLAGNNSLHSVFLLHRRTGSAVCLNGRRPLR